MFPSLPWPFASARSDIPRADADLEDDAPRNDDDARRDISLSAVLHHYATPGIFPPSARVDPTLKLQERPPLRLWHMWKYGMVVAYKATELAGDVLSHHIWGPRKKSWGIEMTIISSFMRGLGGHTSLVDIGTIRMLMGLGGLVPLPSDALVTPVTFCVKRRNLRGILQNLDEAETGRRELSGEWVVGRRTWQRLQTEWKASQAQSKKPLDASHATKTHRKTERVVLYIHGGAYYVSSAAAQRLISIPLAKYTDARVFALDYRLAPEAQFPQPLYDVVSGYFRLVEDLRIPPENIIIAGDSAGGGLSLALLMYLRDNGYPLPSGAILMCPWVDLTMSCESWESNAPFDVIPIPPQSDDPLHPVSLYLGDNMTQYLTHPYASPLFGDFKGLPPLLIQAGDAELLRDEITLLAHKASLAGIVVRHELYEDAVHVFHFYPFLDAAARAFLSMKDFVRNVVTQKRVPQLLDPEAEESLEHEIDTESAFVVRGDGVETATGKENVKEELQVDSERVETSDSDEEVERRRPRYESWGRSAGRKWSVHPFAGHSDEEESSGEDPSPRRQLHRHRSETSAPTLSGFRRIQSALSLVRHDPPHPHHERANTVYHHMHSIGTSVPLDMPFPRSRPRALSRPSVPPSPSIRKSSNASYTDISELVKSWAASGPANQTTMYHPPRN